MTIYEQSHAALDDWKDIVEYTLDNFDIEQTEKYTSGLLRCIEKMAKGQGQFKEIEVHNRKLRVKHCQKHYIFGLVRANHPLMIVAFLHEQMDLIKRLKNRLK